MAENNWKGKTRGGLLGYKIFVFLIRFFGIGSAYFLLIFVALYFVFFSMASTKAIYSFFRLRLQKGILDSTIGVYRTYFSFGQALIDRTAFLAGHTNRFSFDYDGEHHIKSMADAGKGGVLISAHVGNWAIAGNILDDNMSENTQVNVVMLDEEHQKIQEFLDKTQKKQRVNIIGIKNDRSHIFKMGIALQNGELLCMHGDRFLSGAETISVDFFGEKAYLPKGPFQLVCKMNVPYTVVYAFKESFSHYHFYSTPPIENTKGVEDAAQKFANSLEEKIRRYPYQWYNFFDFWQNPDTLSSNPKIA